jgi:maltose alpha-D-glucosyltransferase/alpha-amylase
LRGELPVHGPRTEDAALLEPWVGAWWSWVSHVFVQSYLGALGECEILPRDPEELAVLLDVFLIEKALYEVAYEIDSRPNWVAIPLAGLCALLT